MVMNKIEFRQNNVIGENITDSFVDSYAQELFACHDIIDRVRVCTGEFVTVTFNKKFLEQIIHSHIVQIRKIDAR